MYLRSLEADPDNALCLKEYGEFLLARGNHNDAEKFFTRSSMVDQKYAALNESHPKAERSLGAS